LRDRPSSLILTS